MMNQGNIFLTKEGRTRLEREFAELLRLKVFKTSGESPRIFHSEDINPEFLAFQEDMDLLDARIIELEAILKGAQLIKPPPKDQQNLISLGAKVMIEIDGEEDEFEIIGSLEASPSLGKISNECPVGKNLLGHKVGDEVIVGTNPKIVYKIKKVKY
ncbi:MAG: GreA/GreB family elongation factor [bacterium]|nr:GreA/GreB family elongation factor [bacterium]